MTNGLGVVTAYVYDALNRPVTETDADGTSLARTLTANYDADGNVTSTVDALNNTTTYGYDALNRRISVKNPDGGTTTTGYDANDNVVSITDPLNHTMSYLYDVLNRKTQNTDARGGIVKWVYDLNGNVLSLTDPVNNVTQWVYDALNRQVQELDPLSNGEFSVYDAVDRLTSVTDRNGQKITSSYDLLNRKTGEVWYNAGGSQVNSLTFTYDANNNLLTAANNAGTITRAYDALNRLASVLDSFGTSLTNSYDAADDRTQVQDSFGATTTRLYDVLNRLTSMQLGGTGQTPLREDFTYTVRDQVATQTRFSDLAGQNRIGSSSFTYDSVGRLTNLQHLDGNGNNIANYVNAFDLASRSTLETLNSGTPTNYSYDAANELTNDSVTAYSYDLNGNRTMSGYTTGAANELTSDGTWNYVHDQNGNLVGKMNPTTGETWTFAYDNQNRLISATQTTSTGLQMQATYVSNALGQRIEKDVWTQSGGTVTTRFAYDVGEIWADLTAANALQTRYVRGERVLELLAWMASGTVSWVLADRMGSVRNVVNNTGGAIDTIVYDGYGNVQSESSPANGGSYKYDGYRSDSETGLYRPDPTTGRYYTSSVGRWLSTDPSGLGPDSNPYRYVGNAPANGVDPTGLEFDPRDPTRLTERVFCPPGGYRPYPIVDRTAPGGVWYPPGSPGRGGSRQTPVDVARQVIGARQRRLEMTASLRDVINRRFVDALRPEKGWQVDPRAKVYVLSASLGQRNVGTTLRIRIQTLKASSAPKDSSVEVFIDGIHIHTGVFEKNGQHDFNYKLEWNLTVLNPTLGQVAPNVPAINNGHEVQAIIRPKGVDKKIIFGYYLLEVYPR